VGGVDLERVAEIANASALISDDLSPWIVQTDRPLVLDESQLEPAVAQRSSQGHQRVAQILIVLSDARREISHVHEHDCWKIHTRAPRKRIRPLIVSAGTGSANRRSHWRRLRGPEGCK
jgi:hypothetical protein